MTDPKRTPTYPPHIKPVRVGVYEVLEIGTKYDYFNVLWGGEKWLWCDDNLPLCIQDRSWRGLANPPKGKA